MSNENTDLGAEDPSEGIRGLKCYLSRQLGFFQMQDDKKEGQWFEPYL